MRFSILINGEDFVVVSAEDWSREQETLYVLQNQSLMQQIAESQVTHQAGKGYKPSAKELALNTPSDNEITGV